MLAWKKIHFLFQRKKFPKWLQLVNKESSLWKTVSNFQSRSLKILKKQLRKLWVYLEFFFIKEWLRLLHPFFILRTLSKRLDSIAFMRWNKWVKLSLLLSPNEFPRMPVEYKWRKRIDSFELLRKRFRMDFGVRNVFWFEIQNRPEAFKRMKVTFKFPPGWKKPPTSQQSTSKRFHFCTTLVFETAYNTSQQPPYDGEAHLILFFPSWENSLSRFPAYWAFLKISSFPNSRYRGFRIPKTNICSIWATTLLSCWETPARGKMRFSLNL